MYESFGWLEIWNSNFELQFEIGDSILGITHAIHVPGYHEMWIKNIKKNIKQKKNK